MNVRPWRRSSDAPVAVRADSDMRNGLTARGNRTDVQMGLPTRSLGPCPPALLRFEWRDGELLKGFGKEHLALNGALTAKAQVPVWRSKPDFEVDSLVIHYTGAAERKVAEVFHFNREGLVTRSEAYYDVKATSGHGTGHS